MRRVLVALFCLAAIPASAEFSRITDRTDFLSAVTGKTLTRPLIRLTVTPDGAIDGKGFSLPVSGQWEWKNGFFCRSMDVPGYDIPYNCQEVRVKGRDIRFTSDQGKGQSAVFRLK